MNKQQSEAFMNCGTMRNTSVGMEGLQPKHCMNGNLSDSAGAHG